MLQPEEETLEDIKGIEKKGLTYYDERDFQLTWYKLFSC